MKKPLMTTLLLLFGLFIYAQSPIGTWKTIDDNTGKEKSYVKIYKTNNGKLEGKVAKILTPGHENRRCTACKGDKKDQPIVGLVIIRDLENQGDEWKNGYILDPENGKEYKCKMSLQDENTLDVRGYIGFSLIGRTQTWHRVE